MQFGRLLGRGHLQERLGHLCLIVGNNLVGHVVEKGCKLIVVSLTDRIVFMIVTSSALHGHREKDGRRGVNAIGNVLNVILFLNDSAFRRQHMIATEARGNSLTDGRIRK